MHVRAFVSVCVLIICVTAFPAAVGAQTGVALSGRLVNSLSGDAIPGATVQIDELGRQTMTNPDGMFTFPDIPPGTYHVSVHSQGYSTRRTEVTVSATAATPMEINVDPELHFEEQTTVTGDLRSQFEVYQPTAVLSGQELTKQLEMSLAQRSKRSRVLRRAASGPPRRDPLFVVSTATVCRFCRMASGWATCRASPATTV